MEEQLTAESTTFEKNKFLARTYGWMALALVISAASAFFAAASPRIMLFLWGYNFQTGIVGRPIGIIALCVVEVALVIMLSLKLREMSLKAVIGTFIAYSVINGFTLSSIFWVYEISSIGYCFVGAAVMFGLMCLYGMKTKTDLNKYAKYLIMALFGVLIISLFNVVVGLISGSMPSKFDWILSIAVIVIFAGLTAYDSQRILRAAEQADDRVDYKKLSVYGALELYLDFINIFLKLLRLFGKRR